MSDKRHNHICLFQIDKSAFIESGSGVIKPESYAHILNYTTAVQQTHTADWRLSTGGRTD